MDAIQRASFLDGIYHAIYTSRQASTPSTMRTGSPQPMKVIGAGLPRTGTMSLKAALTRLGLKTYHMQDVLSGNHVALWSAHAEAQPGSETLNPIVERLSTEGYNATTDFPACLVYGMLMERYPDAKVVLSVRTSGDVWAASVLNTIARVDRAVAQSAFGRAAYFPRIFGQLLDWLWRHIGAPREAATGMPALADLARAHDAWTQSVLTAVPTSRLLVHNARDGWAPLCSFLSAGPHADAAITAACADVLANDEEYPHVNESSAMLLVIYAIRSITALIYAAGVLLLVLVGRWLVRCTTRRASAREKSA